jgi:hypothetical protein
VVVGAVAVLHDDRRDRRWERRDSSCPQAATRLVRLSLEIAALSRWKAGVLSHAGAEGLEILVRHACLERGYFLLAVPTTASFLGRIEVDRV